MVHNMHRLKAISQSKRHNSHCVLIPYVDSQFNSCDDVACVTGPCLLLAPWLCICLPQLAARASLGWPRDGILSSHDDVIKYKHFPRYWPFVRGIHRLSVDSPHKGQWRGALMFSLICAPEQTIKQTNKTPVIWDAIAIALIMTSL